MIKNNIRNILTYLFSMVICVCVILIVKDLVNYKKARNEYDRLEKYMNDNAADGVGQSTVELSPARLDEDEITDFDKLYAFNEDLVGILSIPALGMKYPVVQGPDNCTYLYTTFEKNKNPAGCLFIDYENSSDFSDPNTYVYGHNMKDGSMFGSLKKIIREDMEASQVEAYVTTRHDNYKYTMEDAQIVVIDEYKPPEGKEGLMTLYTCWGNDKSRRLLVTFAKEPDINA